MNDQKHGQTYRLGYKYRSILFLLNILTRDYEMLNFLFVTNDLEPACLLQTFFIFFNGSTCSDVSLPLPKSVQFFSTHYLFMQISHT